MFYNSLLLKYINLNVNYTKHCASSSRITLTTSWYERRTMVVVVSVYNTAIVGSKNKRFNHAKYDVHGRDAKKGGNDAAAQHAAAQYNAEQALMPVF